MRRLAALYSSSRRMWTRKIAYDSEFVGLCLAREVMHASCAGGPAARTLVRGHDVSMPYASRVLRRSLSSMRADRHAGRFRHRLAEIDALHMLSSTWMSNVLLGHAG